MVYRFLKSAFLTGLTTLSLFSFSQEQEVEPNSELTGEQLYIQHCSDCHGISGMGTVGNPKVYECFRCEDDLELDAYINARMPPDRRHDCVDDCATKVTQYILGPIALQPAPKLQSKKMTARRLNKQQYKNTVKDLLGINSEIADSFPDDDFGNGFNRMGDVLSLSPLQFELYLKSAKQLAYDSVYQNNVELKTYEIDPQEFVSDAGTLQDTVFNIWSSGSAQLLFNATYKGEYDLKLYFSSHPAGDEKAQFTVYINEKDKGQFSASMQKNHIQSLDLSVFLKEGPNEIRVEFSNDYYNPVLNEDRNLLIGNIVLHGPNNIVQNNKDKSKIFHCDYLTANSDQCSIEIINKFAQKAWRKELSEKESNDLISFFKTIKSQSDSNTQYALSSTFELILSSANFIFQLEPLPKLSNETNEPLNEYAIASRLSYFLWDSMPDDELFDLAKNKKLSDKIILEKQIDRMIKDEKSNALLDGFFGQWLLINALEDHSVDTSLFPKYKKGLNKQLLKESQLLFLDYIKSEMPFKNILTNDYTYANKFLANFYEFEGDFDREFKKVDLAQYPERWGLLSQASLLTVTSHPNRTSVVKRGKWVMSNFLCQEPPPPPPGVEGINDTIKIEAKTLREQMQIHAGTPQCRSCHVTMDAIGFAFEQYDAVGQFRTHYDDEKIDSTGDIGKNKKFKNAQELAHIIKDDARFESCVAKKLYTYALSSGITANDELFIKQIVKNWKETDSSFKSLVKSIVKSDAFLTHSYWDYNKSISQTNTLNQAQ